MAAEHGGRIPAHVAIIMDGNGRWARRRGLPRAFGHRAGVKALRRAVEACSDLGVRYLTAYTFSTENWQRPGTEVRALMRLFSSSIDTHRAELAKNNVRVCTIGRVEDVPPAIRDKFARLVADTATNSGLTLTLAISYGARAEIVDACRRAVERRRAPTSESAFARLLYNPDLPDPDLLIRTGGEQRISNFLLWQLAYTELYFTDTLWPDFGRAELTAAIEEYGNRQRRFGRVR